MVPASPIGRMATGSRTFQLRAKSNRRPRDSRFRGKSSRTKWWPNPYRNIPLFPKPLIRARWARRLRLYFFTIGNTNPERSGDSGTDPSRTRSRTLPGARLHPSMLLRLKRCTRPIFDRSQVRCRERRIRGTHGIPGWRGRRPKITSGLRGILPITERLRRWWENFPLRWRFRFSNPARRPERMTNSGSCWRRSGAM